MLELYQGKAESSARCPGEDDCQLFQSAAFVEDHDETGEPWGKRHVCRSCELVATKPPKLTQIETAFETEELARIVDQIESLAAEQQAGFSYTPAELTPLEFELLCHWHACVRSFERAQQTHLTQMLGALFR